MPLPDVMIASLAVVGHLTVLHHDRDFDRINPDQPGLRRASAGGDVSGSFLIEIRITMVSHRLP
ncbi:MAG: hypothetical protein ACRDUV_08400 [Pseudonocardiaceae bacterium]